MAENLFSLLRGSIVASTREADLSFPPAFARQEITMHTQGEMEAMVCDGVTHFQQHCMGRGPKQIESHLLGNLLLVRLQGALTQVEQHLAASSPPERGRDLLKQVRSCLVETGRPLLERTVREATGVAVISLHHDISTVTGEEILVFVLSSVPEVRNGKRK